VGSEEDVARKFWEARAQRPDFLWRDLAELNFKVLSPLLRPHMNVLDLGAGDGRLTSMIADRVNHVHAVDYTSAVNRISNAKVSREISDIRVYETRERYDLIVLFGVMNFIEDETLMYSKCSTWLSPLGRLAVKHQCGRDGLVSVSTSIGGVPYRSTYPYLGTEVTSLLKAGFRAVEVSKPYPEELNIWKDTVYVSFIASK